MFPSSITSSVAQPLPEVVDPDLGNAPDDQSTRATSRFRVGHLTYR